MGQAKIKKLRQQREASVTINTVSSVKRVADEIKCEQFKQLLASSQQQGIQIDCDGVPPEMRSDLRFFESYEQMYNEVTNLNWVGAFCLHEAGHRLYLAFIGVTEFEYLPPTIRYNKSTDDYDGHRAAVQVIPFNLPIGNMPVDQIIWNLAKGFAAGATLAEYLANAPRNGEEADRSRFNEACSAFVNADVGLVSIDTDSAWAQARNAIVQDMKNPENSDAAFRTAEEIKTEIFPWIKAPITPFPKSPHPLNASGL